MANKRKQSEPEPPKDPKAVPEKPARVKSPPPKQKLTLHKRPVIDKSSSDDELEPALRHQRRRVTFSATTTVHDHPTRQSLPNSPRVRGQQLKRSIKGGIPLQEKQQNPKIKGKIPIPSPQLSKSLHDLSNSRVIRGGYSELMQECQSFEKEPQNDETDNKIKDNIIKGKKLFERIGDGPADMHMAFLHTRNVTSVIRSRAENIGNENSGFKIEHYLNCIQQNISSPVNLIDPQKYRYLAGEANLAFRTTPSFTALVGAFDRDKIFVPKEKKQRVSIRRKRFEDEKGNGNEEVTNANNQVQGDKAPADVVSKAINRVVVKKYEKTHRSLNLVQLSLDRRSFPRTIDNLFNTSFLIKEGKLVLDKDDSEDEESKRQRRTSGVPKSNFREGTLVVYPQQIEEPKSSSQAPKHQVLNRNQHIVSFNSAMWKHICEKTQGECFINVSINKYRNKMRLKDHHMRLSRLGANIDPNKPPPSDEQMRIEAKRSSRAYRMASLPLLPTGFIRRQGVFDPRRPQAKPQHANPAKQPSKTQAPNPSKENPQRKEVVRIPEKRVNIQAPHSKEQVKGYVKGQSQAKGQERSETKRHTVVVPKKTPVPVKMGLKSWGVGKRPIEIKVPVVEKKRSESPASKGVGKRRQSPQEPQIVNPVVPKPKPSTKRGEKSKEIEVQTEKGGRTSPRKGNVQKEVPMDISDNERPTRQTRGRVSK